MSVSSPTVSGPVVFDPYSEDFFCAPFETYRRMRDEAPVYYSEKYDFWALTRYDDVAAAIKDHETYSSAKGVTLDIVKVPGAESPMGKIIISLDPPEHERMRKLVNKRLHSTSDRVPRTNGQRHHRSHGERTRSVVVRRGRRFLGIVPGGDHHRDARCSRRRQTTTAALARQGSGTRAGLSFSLGRESRRHDPVGRLLLPVDTGTSRRAAETT